MFKMKNGFVMCITHQGMYGFPQVRVFQKKPQNMDSGAQLPPLKIHPGPLEAQ